MNNLGYFIIEYFFNNDLIRR